LGQCTERKTLRVYLDEKKIRPNQALLLLFGGGGVLRFRFPRFYGFAGLFIGLCAHWKRIRLSVK